jgi:hypothetical protein
MCNSFSNLISHLISVRLTKYMYDDGLLGQKFLRDTLIALTEGDDEWRLAIWLFLVQTFLFEYQRSISLMRLLLKALFNLLAKVRIICNA